jgi:hypothetical protein
MATLLMIGTQYRSSLSAQEAELTEQYTETIEAEIHQVNESEICNVYEGSHCTSEMVVTEEMLDESITEIEEEVIQISCINEVVINQITKIEITAPEEETILEADFDAMVDELVESGAVEDDISALETQPQWKLLLARISSYALSLGISCKESVMNLYSNVQRTLTNYLTTNK